MAGTKPGQIGARLAEMNRGKAAALLVWLPFTFVRLDPAETGFRLHDEALHYSINWPSGLSLGEAHLRAAQLKSQGGAAEKWRFEMAIDAAVPGFAVSDQYHSTATGELCSLSLEKQFVHGKHRTHEWLTFDQSERVVKRETEKGGKSEYSVSSCAKDALAFIYYARRELSQGRVPPAQTVIFGAPYQVRLEYTGAQTVSVSEKRIEADRMTATLKGPASDASFELFFARDPARTPVALRIPLALGAFSIELIR